MKTGRSLTAAVAAAALFALGGAAIAGTLAQNTGAVVELGGFDFGGGVAESGGAQLSFAGTEFGTTDTASGFVVTPGFAAAALCFDDNDGLTNLREEAAGTNPCVYDTDGDGLADGGDVEFIQAAVTALPHSAFGGHGAEGLRTSMQSILNAIETHLLAGKPRDGGPNIENLRRRIDGCASPTGKADTNDWIVDCPSQLSIRGDLDLLGQNVRRRP